jgi:WD40 repeat protein/Tfp pilus assembly protein PilF
MLTINELADNLPDPLDDVVEEVLGRSRRGESPSVDEYAQRYPDLAVRIRALFPALLLMEGKASSSCSPQQAPPQLPPALGPFRILCEVGRGGMGVVYEAVQEPLGRRVALKVLPPDCARRPSFRERFGREAAAAAQPHHTNIVPVFASGEHDGTLYFAMQFIDGRTVADLVAELRVATERSSDHFRLAVRLAMQAAEALACAHSHGILHRDIKPANLLVDTAGSLWVADFGLAKIDDAEDLTGTGELIGTLRYLAPERFAGKCDARSDIYALGATLYEMLALRPAFYETDRLRLVQQVAHGAPPLRQAAPRLPPDLETVVHKAMATDPADRYASAQDMADDLRLFLADLPIKARRARAWERLRRWSRHNPALAWMTATVASLLVVVAVGASLLSLELGGALGRARLAEQDTQLKLFDSLVAQGRAVTRGRRSGQRFEALSLLDQASELARRLDLSPEKRTELRNVAVAALAVPDLYPIQAWDGFPPGSQLVDFDDQLAIYARTDERGNCTVCRVGGNIPIAFLPHPDSGKPEAFPVLSRDGRFVAVRQASGLTHVWQLDGAGVTRVLEQEKVGHLEFHPNRPQVVFCHEDGRVNLWELPAGQLVASLRPDRLVRRPYAALHPTEPLVAIVSYPSKTVMVRDLRSGEVVKRLELPINAFHIAWHPAGHTLAASDGDGRTVHLFDRATFRCRRTFQVTGGGPSIAYNRVGDRLAVADWSGNVGLYEPATGQLLVHVHTPGRTIVQPRFSADGRRLAGFTEGGQLGIWEVGEGREYHSLRWSGKEDPGVNRAAVSPDGRLAVAAMAGGVAFWDLDQGTELDYLPLENPARIVAFEPGGEGALLLGDQSGLYRWPVHPDPGAPGRRRIGPPQALNFPAGMGFASSADGRVWATDFPIAHWCEPWAGAWVRHADRPDQPLHLDPGADTRGIAVSPNGRWVITNGHGNAHGVKLWNARTGELVQTLRERGGEVCFSPDGRWLYVGGTEGCLLDVGSWEERRKLGDWGQFSPDGRMMVIRTNSNTALGLFEPDTGRQLARLEDPDLPEPWNAAFSPDGSRLLVVVWGGIRVWDLRRIRTELARRDLDWDAPPYPPEPVATDPLTVELDLGDFRQLRPQRLAQNYDRSVRSAEHIGARWYFRGRWHMAAGRYVEAVRDLREAVARRPDSPLMSNDLAWLYVAGPEPLRNPQAAVSLAERAVKLQPGIWQYANTLGIAYYRAGRYSDALTQLQKSLAGGGGETETSDLYFLAMCYHWLGDPDRARDSWQRAQASHDAKSAHLSSQESAELESFRAEAEKTLAQSNGR